MRALLFEEKIRLFVENKIFLKFEDKAKSLSKKSIGSRNRNLLHKLYEHIIPFYGADFFFFILIVLAIIDKVYIFILFYGITTPILVFLLYFYEIRRGYSWVYDFFLRSKILK